MKIIERVARAICIAAQIDPDRKGNETEWRWQEFLPEARAALKELREPTAAMIDAGCDASEERDPEIYWKAMIDAALAE